MAVQDAREVEKMLHRRYGGGVVPVNKQVTFVSVDIRWFKADKIYLYRLTMRSVKPCQSPSHKITRPLKLRKLFLLGL